MPGLTIERLKVRASDDPLFSTVARAVNPPARQADQTLFLPAYDGFNIAEGSKVDISYFYEPSADEPWTKPKQTFDRHVRTDELWVAMEGDMWVAMAPCRRPDDPQDTPQPGGHAVLRDQARRRLCGATECLAHRAVADPARAGGPLLHALERASQGGLRRQRRPHGAPASPRAPRFCPTSTHTGARAQ